MIFPKIQSDELMSLSGFLTECRRRGWLRSYEYSSQKITPRKPLDSRSDVFLKKQAAEVESYTPILPDLCSFVLPGCNEAERNEGRVTNRKGVAKYSGDHLLVNLAPFMPSLNLLYLPERV